MFVKRVATFILYDPAGRLLLQHRDKNAIDSPNHWGLFGGVIEANETPEQALLREADEELGIRLKNMKLFKRYEYMKKGRGLQEKFVFIGKLTYDLKTLKQQQKEGDDLNLFSKEEVNDLLITDHNKLVLKEVFVELESYSA